MQMRLPLFCALYLLCADNTNAQRRRPKVVTSGDKLSSLPKKKVDYDYNEYEYPTQNAHPVVEDSGEHEQQELRESYANSKPSKKPGFSAGSGLRSIAQGSADQASSAVSNQHAAAKQAAYVAQNTLAQAASQAAATAQVSRISRKGFDFQMLWFIHKIVICTFSIVRIRLHWLASKYFYKDSNSKASKRVKLSMVKFCNYNRQNDRRRQPNNPPSSQ